MRLRRAERETPDINMTPVIDCVFQLMIFFLVATQVRTDVVPDIALPAAARAEEAPPGKAPLVVNILRPEVGRARPYVVGGQVCDLEGFRTLMKQRSALYGQLGEEMPVLRLRADRDSQFRQIQDCLIACRDAGFWRVRLTALKKPK